MEKRFIIVNKGKDKYGLTYSNLNSGELININNIFTLKNITDVGRESDTIILKDSNILSIGDGFNDYVSDLEFLDNGDIILIGAFTEYNGTPLNNIVKLKSNGSIDNSFQVGTGLVGLMVFSGLNHFLLDKSDGGIWLVGSFTSYNGTPANGIIKLDKNGGKITGFNYGAGFQPSFRVYGIKADTMSNSIFCHGIFTTYNGISSNYIAKLLPNGNFDTGFDYGIGFNNAVTSLKVNADGSIICAGYFITYKGISSTRIIKIDRYGNKITGFNPGASFNSSIIYLNDDDTNTLYAIGYFTTYKGSIVNRIVKIDINTGDIDLSFNSGSGFNQATIAMVLNADGSIYIGGEFTTYNSIPCNRIIKLNPDGSIDNSFNIGSGFDNSVLFIGVRNGRITVTGEFTTYNGVVAKNIVVLNPDGSIYNGSEFSFLNGRAEYNKVNLEDTTEQEILPKSLIEQLINETKVIDVDYTELGNLISNKELKKDYVYKLTHSLALNSLGLKSMYLKSIENNLLSNNGFGVFYTPKYQTGATGYGIWNNKMTSFSLNIATGSFTINEYINGNNGSIGIFRSNDLIDCISGSWSSTTLITGSSSGVTASVSGLVSPTYASGSNVIWGGKHWINKNGTLGSEVNKYSLNSTSWKEIEFNEFDYNISVDEIKYDYDADIIYYRKDKYNNEISTTFNRVNIDLNSYQPSISDFQWGNGYYGQLITYDLKVGVVGNKLHNSYFNCLNTTSTIWYNDINYSNIKNIITYNSNLLNNKIHNSTIDNINLLIKSSLNNNNIVESTINNSIFSNISKILSNNINSSQILNNIIYSSNMSNNTFDLSQISNNKSFGNGSISYNKLNNSSILNNIFSGYDAHLEYNVLDNSNISNNTFNNGSNSYLISNKMNYSSIVSNYVGNIEGNNMNYGQILSNISFGRINNNIISDSIITLNSLDVFTSSITKNNIISSTISNMTFSNTKMINNTINNSYFKLSNVLTTKLISNLSIESIPNVFLNLSTASVIFQNYPRTLYMRPDGSIRLRYYDNSDLLVIGNYFI